MRAYTVTLLRRTTKQCPINSIAWNRIKERIRIRKERADHYVRASKRACGRACSFTLAWSWSAVIGAGSVSGMFAPNSAVESSILFNACYINRNGCRHRHRHRHNHITDVIVTQVALHVRTIRLWITARAVRQPTRNCTTSSCTIL